jgi:hypothetical protein
MAGNVLTVSASLQCPHGGTVQIIPANSRAKADGALIATAADTFTIVGCPFPLPAAPTTPSPCVTVQWLVTDMRVKASASLTLSQSSQGLCLSALQVPQGAVVIQSTQTKAASQ